MTFPRQELKTRVASLSRFGFLTVEVLEKVASPPIAVAILESSDQTELVACLVRPRLISARRERAQQNHPETILILAQHQTPFMGHIITADLSSGNCCLRGLIA